MSNLDWTLASAVVQLGVYVMLIYETVQLFRWERKFRKDDTLGSFAEFVRYGFWTLTFLGLLILNQPFVLEKEPIAIDIVIHSNGDLEVISEPTEADVKASLGEFTVTGYCSCEKCCGDFADGITATGTVATEGRTVAADPNVLPYGTEIEIDGRKYVVEDCGSAIKGNQLDLYFDSHEAALQWGVQTKEVFRSEAS